MSTIVVVRKGGLAAVGADTLISYASSKEDARYVCNHSKILTVGNSRLAWCGPTSFGMVLKSYFDGLEQPPVLDSAQAIFEVARALHKALKDDYFLNPSENEGEPFESSQFDLVLANKCGIFGIDSLRAVQEYTRFAANGSGYEFAMGAMRALYDSPLGAADIAEAGLEAACDFDNSTGPPVEIMTVELATPATA